MNKSDGGADCTLGSVVMAALIAALAVVVMRFFAELSWTGSIFVGGLALAVLSLLFIWIFCRELPALGDIEAPGSATLPKGASGSADASSETAAAPSTSAAASAAPAAAPAPDVTAPTAPAASAEPAVKSSQLPGQEDLAARKGEWRYNGGDDAAAAPAEDKSAAPKPAAAPAAPEEAADAQRPEGLTEARGGSADNLKEIKGIGPKLEKLCNSLGFYHFDQIAAWTADEVAWVDQNLEGFKGRVTRDEWVAQAKILASGGETEFSKRVDDGNVY